MSNYSARNGAKDAPVNRPASSGQAFGEDFPMLCETCLGSNPYVRMTKLPFGAKLCKISNLPYQAFRWKAGPNGRHKETIVSYAVAAERNICQTCLNDMRYGLPVGVRDALLSQPDNQVALPDSKVGQMYFYGQQAERLENGLVTHGDFSHEMVNAAPVRQLDKFARAMQVAEARSKTAFRNLPKLCSFWLNGSCTRVVRKTCPFRPCCGEYVFPEIAGSHRELCQQLVDQLKAEGPAAVQKKIDKDTRTAFQQSMKGNREDAIRKRVAGDDDLTKKYLGRMKSMNMQLTPPDDPSIVTLWIGNVSDDISEDDLRGAIYAYGLIANLTLVRSAKCAFVEYVNRESAEYAATQLYNALMVSGHPLNVNWAKPKTQAMAGSTSTVVTDPLQMLPPPGMEGKAETVYSLPGVGGTNFAKPPLPDTLYPSEGQGQEGRPPPPSSAPPAKKQRSEANVVYPSMNPSRMGTSYN